LAMFYEMILLAVLVCVGAFNWFSQHDCRTEPSFESMPFSIYLRHPVHHFLRKKRHFRLCHPEGLPRELMLVLANTF
jgi:hypothetical protein